MQTVPRAPLGHVQSQRETVTISYAVHCQVCGSTNIKAENLPGVTFLHCLDCEEARQTFGKERSPDPR